METADERVARVVRYEGLKARLAAATPQDRSAYTQGKTSFVVRVTDQAKRYYGSV